MKCEAHPEQDAIGCCVFCGKGMCQICKTKDQGRLYCKKCYKNGKIYISNTKYYQNHYYPISKYNIPSSRVPKRTNYLLGAAGACLSGVSTFLSAFLLGLPYLLSTLDDPILFLIPTNGLFFGLLLIAEGLYGFYYNFGSKLSLTAVVILIIFAFLLFVPIFFRSVYLFGLILSIACIFLIIILHYLVNHQFLDTNIPLKVASILLLIGSGFLITFIGIFFWGWIIIGIGFIFLMPTFIKAKLPII